MPKRRSTDTSNESEFCRDIEAVKVTPFPIRTFRHYVADGLIPSYKFGGAHLFKKSEVIAAIEKCRDGTTAEVLS